MDKRQQLIQTAFELFYRDGIHAVGINQILQQSGIAKKTLYHHFASKEELVAAVLAYRDSVFYDWLQSRIDSTELGIAALDAIFDALDDWFNNRTQLLTDFHGCFFINSCAEYGDPAHPVHQQCAAHKQRISVLIRRHVAELSMTTEQTDELTESIALLKEGAIVLAHVQGELQAALKAKRLLHLLLLQYQS